MFRTQVLHHPPQPVTHPSHHFSFFPCVSFFNRSSVTCSFFPRKMLRSDHSGSPLPLRGQSDDASIQLITMVMLPVGDGDGIYRSPTRPTCSVLPSLSLSDSLSFFFFVSCSSLHFPVHLLNVSSSYSLFTCPSPFCRVLLPFHSRNRLK